MSFRLLCTLCVLHIMLLLSRPPIWTQLPQTGQSEMPGYKTLWDKCAALNLLLLRLFCVEMQFLGYNETKKLSIVQFIMRNYREISTVVCAGQHDVRKQLRGNFHLCQMKLLVLAAPEATGRCNCCICGGGGASTYLTCQKIFFGFIQKRRIWSSPKVFSCPGPWEERLP